jgi:phosphoglycolate phosphatase-like HAD superfamily hydrolase
MSALAPKLLALDFDGVICDGLKEYFQSTKLAYIEIWGESDALSRSGLAPSFYRLRPIIETGWEMPVLLRALVLGMTEDRILENWSFLVQDIVNKEKLDWKAVGKKLDSVRDKWIESDLAGWLNLHGFYPGIIDRLARIISSDTDLYIVTTKEGRFVKQLLGEVGIELPDSVIFGKEYSRPKYETLRQIINDKGLSPVDVYFVEDRLEALESVREQPDLQGIGLYLADWGYNTQQTRDSLQCNKEINLLSLEEFNGDFSAWRSLNQLTIGFLGGSSG